MRPLHMSFQHRSHVQALFVLVCRSGWSFNGRKFQATFVKKKSRKSILRVRQDSNTKRFYSDTDTDPTLVTIWRSGAE